MAPERVIWSRICRDPGVAVAETSSSEMRAAPQRRRRERQVLVEELTEEPMQTWVSWVPTTSSTGTTLPGLDGFATSGTSSARSMCSSSSKSPVPPVGSVDEVLRRAPARHPGARLVVGGENRAGGPSSAIMFAIVPRSV